MPKSQKKSIQNSFLLWMLFFSLPYFSDSVTNLMTLDANNGNLYRSGRFSPWHFWADHGFVLFGPNISHFLRCKQTSIPISAILILPSYLHMWNVYTQYDYHWKRYLRFCVFHRIKLAWSIILKTSKYRFSMGIHSSKNRLWRNTGRSRIRFRWVSSSTVRMIFRS